MPETNTQSQPNAEPQASAPKDGTMVIRLPKPNMQIAILGLVAVITVFQTVQLFNISNRAGSAQVKASSSTTSNVGGGTTGSNAGVPQSMVGGC